MKKLLLICLWLAFAASHLLPAQSKLDSLYQIWTDASQMDSLRASAMQKYIQEGFIFSKPDTAFILAQELYDFAEKQGLKRYMATGLWHQSIVCQQNGQYPQGIELAQRSIPLYRAVGFELGVASSYSSVGILLNHQGEFRRAYVYFDSAYQIYEGLQDTSRMALMLGNMGLYYKKTGAMAEAAAYFERARALAESIGDERVVVSQVFNLSYAHQALGQYTLAIQSMKEALAYYQAKKELNQVSEIHYQMGVLYHEMGDNDSAIYYLEQSLELSQAMGNPLLQFAGLNFMGSVYSRKGDYLKGIELISQSIRIIEATDHKLNTAVAYGSLGDLYRDQKEYEQARKYYQRSLAINREIGSKQGMAENQASIGNIFMDEGQYEQALASFKESLRWAEEIEAQKDISYALASIGNLYRQQENYPPAIEYCQRALQIYQEIENPTGMAMTANFLGFAYLAQGKYPQAIEAGTQALAHARQAEIAAEIQQSSELLYRAYKATGRNTEALAMYELHIQMRDSISNDENIKAILQQQFQYEFEKKEALAQVEQEKKDELARAALARQNLQRNSALGGMALVGVLAFVLYRNSRRRQQTNRLLSDQNQQIEAKSNQNELLLKEIHHRVKNNLQTISSLLYLQSAHIKDAEVKEAVAEGQHRVESMALIHQKLYQRENLAAIEMKDYLSNLGESLLNTFDYDPERIELQLDMETLELDVDTAVPLGLIVNELITNSLKYAFPQGRSGQIRISLGRLPDGKLELYVGDDGVGAANALSGTSFGSQLVKLLTQQLGGRIEQGSETGYWTRVVV